MTQQEAHNRLRRIRDEMRSIRYALGRAEAKWDVEAGTAAVEFRGRITLDEIRRAASNLEHTFIIRLFAEIEGILLDFWQNGLGQGSEPKAFDLITAVAARCPLPISDSHRDDVHHVRRYRNNLVHPRAEKVDPLTFDQCLTRVGKYLAYFPQNW